MFQAQGGRSGMTRPALVSAAVANGDFGLARRECGTAPGGATRSSRSPRARRAGSGERKREVLELLKDEAWFADADSPLDDGLGLDDCPSPTLFLNEPSQLFDDIGRNGAYNPDEAGDVSDGEDLLDCSPDSRSAAGAQKLAMATAGGDVANGLTPRSGSGRSRVEGGMNLSPRGSFERAAGKKKGGRSQNGAAHNSRDPPESLKGLLNSADMEDRLAAAQNTRLGPGPSHNLRLMIPSPNMGSIQQLERPPSRQRNLPMHLNSDLSLELPSHDGQLSPDVERKCVPLHVDAAAHRA